MEIRARKGKSQRLSHQFGFRRQIRDPRRMDKGTKVLETAGGGVARGSTVGRSEGRYEDEEARSLDRQEDRRRDRRGAEIREINVEEKVRLKS